MSSTNDGGPAFPAVGQVYGVEGDSRWAAGMTLRDYFAANCPVSRPDWWEGSVYPVPEPKGPESLGYSHGCTNGKPSLPEDDPRYNEVKKFWEDQKVADKERQAWRVRRDLFLETAWAYEYADTMIAQRESGGAS